MYSLPLGARSYCSLTLRSFVGVKSNCARPVGAINVQETFKPHIDERIPPIAILLIPHGGDTKANRSLDDGPAALELRP